MLELRDCQSRSDESSMFETVHELTALDSG